ncbi:MAG TPA: ATP-binding protein, partial [Turneriella sp.]|nr:ATP-binding protein [Turneriella sp.]
MLPDTLERDSARHRLRKIPAAFRKEYKDILHEVGSLIAEYSLIEQGDRVMVAVSGGKDSHALLHILLDLQAKAPIDFSVVAYTLDQKQPG